MADAFHSFENTVNPEINNVTRELDWRLINIESDDKKFQSDIFVVAAQSEHNSYGPGPSSEEQKNESFSNGCLSTDPANSEVCGSGADSRHPFDLQKRDQEHRKEEGASGLCLHNDWRLINVEPSVQVSLISPEKASFDKYVYLDQPGPSTCYTYHDVSVLSKEDTQNEWKMIKVEPAYQQVSPTSSQCIEDLPGPSRVKKHGTILKKPNPDKHTYIENSLSLHLERPHQVISQSPYCAQHSSRCLQLQKQPMERENQKRVHFEPRSECELLGLCDGGQMEYITNDQHSVAKEMIRRWTTDNTDTDADENDSLASSEEVLQSHILQSFENGSDNIKKMDSKSILQTNVSIVINENSSANSNPTENNTSSTDSSSNDEKDESEPEATCMQVENLDNSENIQHNEDLLDNFTGINPSNTCTTSRLPQDLRQVNKAEQHTGEANQHSAADQTEKKTLSHTEKMVALFTNLQVKQMSPPLQPEQSKRVKTLDGKVADYVHCFDERKTKCTEKTNLSLVAGKTDQLETIHSVGTDISPHISSSAALSSHTSQKNTHSSDFQKEKPNMPSTHKQSAEAVLLVLQSMQSILVRMARIANAKMAGASEGDEVWTHSLKAKGRKQPWEFHCPKDKEVMPDGLLAYSIAHRVVGQACKKITELYPGCVNWEQLHSDPERDFMDRNSASVILALTAMKDALRDLEGRGSNTLYTSTAVETSDSLSTVSAGNISEGRGSNTLYTSTAVETSDSLSTVSAGNISEEQEANSKKAKESYGVVSDIITELVQLVTRGELGIHERENKEIDQVLSLNSVRSTEDDILNTELKKMSFELVSRTVREAVSVLVKTKTVSTSDTFCTKTQLLPFQSRDTKDETSSGNETTIQMPSSTEIDENTPQKNEQSATYLIQSISKEIYDLITKLFNYLESSDCTEEISSLIMDIEKDQSSMVDCMCGKLSTLESRLSLKNMSVEKNSSNLLLRTVQSGTSCTENAVDSESERCKEYQSRIAGNSLVKESQQSSSETDPVHYSVSQEEHKDKERWYDSKSTSQNECQGREIERSVSAEEICQSNDSTKCLSSSSQTTNSSIERLFNMDIGTYRSRVALNDQFLNGTNSGEIFEYATPSTLLGMQTGENSREDNIFGQIGFGSMQLVRSSDLIVIPATILQMSRGNHPEHVQQADQNRPASTGPSKKHNGQQVSQKASTSRSMTTATEGEKKPNCWNTACTPCYHLSRATKILDCLVRNKHSCSEPKLDFYKRTKLLDCQRTRRQLLGSPESNISEWSVLSFYPPRNISDMAGSDIEENEADGDVFAVECDEDINEVEGEELFGVTGAPITRSATDQPLSVISTTMNEPKGLSIQPHGLTCTTLERHLPDCNRKRPDSPTINHQNTDTSETQADCSGAKEMDRTRQSESRGNMHLAQTQTGLEYKHTACENNEQIISSVYSVKPSFSTSQSHDIDDTRNQSPRFSCSLCHTSVSSASFISDSKYHRNEKLTSPEIRSCLKATNSLTHQHKCFEDQHRHSSSECNKHYSCHSRTDSVASERPCQNLRTDYSHCMEMHNAPSNKHLTASRVSVRGCCSSFHQPAESDYASHQPAKSDSTSHQPAKSDYASHQPAKSDYASHQLSDSDSIEQDHSYCKRGHNTDPSKSCSQKKRFSFSVDDFCDPRGENCQATTGSSCGKHTSVDSQLGSNNKNVNGTGRGGRNNSSGNSSDSVNSSVDIIHDKCSRTDRKDGHALSCFQNQLKAGIEDIKQYMVAFSSAQQKRKTSEEVIQADFKHDPSCFSSCCTSCTTAHHGNMPQDCHCCHRHQPLSRSAPSTCCLNSLSRRAMDRFKQKSTTVNRSQPDRSCRGLNSCIDRHCCSGPSVSLSTSQCSRQSSGNVNIVDRNTCCRPTDRALDSTSCPFHSNVVSGDDFPHFACPSSCSEKCDCVCGDKHDQILDTENPIQPGPFYEHLPDCCSHFKACRCRSQRRCCVRDTKACTFWTTDKGSRDVNGSMTNNHQVKTNHNGADIVTGRQMHTTRNSQGEQQTTMLTDGQNKWIGKVTVDQTSRVLKDTNRTFKDSQKMRCVISPLHELGNIAAEQSKKMKGVESVPRTRDLGHSYQVTRVSSSIMTTAMTILETLLKRPKSDVSDPHKRHTVKCHRVASSSVDCESHPSQSQRAMQMKYSEDTDLGKCVNEDRRGDILTSITDHDIQIFNNADGEEKCPCCVAPVQIGSHSLKGSAVFCDQCSVDNTRYADNTFFTARKKMTLQSSECTKFDKDEIKTCPKCSQVCMKSHEALNAKTNDENKSNSSPNRYSAFLVCVGEEAASSAFVIQPLIAPRTVQYRDTACQTTCSDDILCTAFGQLDQWSERGSSNISVVNSVNSTDSEGENLEVSEHVNRRSARLHGAVIYSSPGSVTAESCNSYSSVETAYCPVRSHSLSGSSTENAHKKTSPFHISRSGTLSVLDGVCEISHSSCKTCYKTSEMHTPSVSEVDCRQIKKHITQCFTSGKSDHESGSENVENAVTDSADFTYSAKLSDSSEPIERNRIIWDSDGRTNTCTGIEHESKYVAAVNLRAASDGAVGAACGPEIQEANIPCAETMTTYCTVVASDSGNVDPSNLNENIYCDKLASGVSCRSSHMDTTFASTSGASFDLTGSFYDSDSCVDSAIVDGDWNDSKICSGMVQTPDIRNTNSRQHTGTENVSMSNATTLPEHERKTFLCTNFDTENPMTGQSESDSAGGYSSCRTDPEQYQIKPITIPEHNESRCTLKADTDCFHPTPQSDFKSSSTKSGSCEHVKSPCSSISGSTATTPSTSTTSVILTSNPMDMFVNVCNTARVCSESICSATSTLEYIASSSSSESIQEQRPVETYKDLSTNMNYSHSSLIRGLGNGVDSNAGEVDTDTPLKQSQSDKQLGSIGITGQRGTKDLWASLQLLNLSSRATRLALESRVQSLQSILKKMENCAKVVPSESLSSKQDPPPTSTSTSVGSLPTASPRHQWLKTSCSDELVQIVHQQLEGLKTTADHQKRLQHDTPSALDHCEDMNSNHVYTKDASTNVWLPDIHSIGTITDINRQATCTGCLSTVDKSDVGVGVDNGAFKIDLMNYSDVFTTICYNHIGVSANLPKIKPHLINYTDSVDGSKMVHRTNLRRNTGTSEATTDVENFVEKFSDVEVVQRGVTIDDNTAEVMNYADSFGASRLVQKGVSTENDIKPSTAHLCDTSTALHTVDRGAGTDCVVGKESAHIGVGVKESEFEVTRVDFSNMFNDELPLKTDDCVKNIDCSCMNYLGACNFREPESMAMSDDESNGSGSCMDPADYSIIESITDNIENSLKQSHDLAADSSSESCMDPSECFITNSTIDCVENSTIEGDREHMQIHITESDTEPCKTKISTSSKRPAEINMTRNDNEADVSDWAINGHGLDIDENSISGNDTDLDGNSLSESDRNSDEKTVIRNDKYTTKYDIDGDVTDMAENGVRGSDISLGENSLCENDTDLHENNIRESDKGPEKHNTRGNDVILEENVNGSDIDSEESVRGSDTDPDEKFGGSCMITEENVSGSDADPEQKSFSGSYMNTEENISGHDTDPEESFRGNNKDAEANVSGTDIDSEEKSIRGSDADPVENVSRSDINLEENINVSDSDLANIFTGSDLDPEKNANGSDTDPEENANGSDMYHEEHTTESDVDPEENATGRDMYPDEIANGSDMDPEENAIGSDMDPEENANGSDTDPEENANGSDMYPEESTNESDVDPEENANGSDTDPEENANGSDMYPEENTNESDVDPEENATGRDMYPEEIANGSDTDPEEIANGSDMDPEENANGSDMDPEENANGRDMYPEENANGSDMDPEENANGSDMDPEENANGSDMDPEESTNESDVDPEENANGRDMYPEEIANGGDMDPEENANGSDMYPEENANGRDMYPEENANGRDRYPEEIANGSDMDTEENVNRSDVNLEENTNGNDTDSEKKVSGSDMNPKENDNGSGMDPEEGVSVSDTGSHDFPMDMLSCGQNSLSVADYVVDDRNVYHDCIQHFQLIGAFMQDDLCGVVEASSQAENARDAVFDPPTPPVHTSSSARLTAVAHGLLDQGYDELKSCSDPARSQHISCKKIKSCANLQVERASFNYAEDTVVSSKCPRKCPQKRRKITEGGQSLGVSCSGVDDVRTIEKSASWSTLVSNVSDITHARKGQDSDNANGMETKVTSFSFSMKESERINQGVMTDFVYEKLTMTTFGATFDKYHETLKKRLGRTDRGVSAVFEKPVEQRLGRTDRGVSAVFEKPVEEGSTKTETRIFSNNFSAMTEAQSDHCRLAVKGNTMGSDAKRYLDNSFDDESQEQDHCLLEEENKVKPSDRPSISGVSDHINSLQKPQDVTWGTERPGTKQELTMEISGEQCVCDRSTTRGDHVNVGGKGLAGCFTSTADNIYANKNKISLNSCSKAYGARKKILDSVFLQEGEESARRSDVPDSLDHSVSPRTEHEDQGMADIADTQSEVRCPQMLVDDILNNTADNCAPSSDVAHSCEEDAHVADTTHINEGDFFIEDVTHTNGGRTRIGSVDQSEQDKDTEEVTSREPPRSSGEDLLSGSSGEDFSDYDKDYNDDNSEYLEAEDELEENKQNCSLEGWKEVVSEQNQSDNLPDCTVAATDTGVQCSILPSSSDQEQNTSGKNHHEPHSLSDITRIHKFVQRSQLQESDSLQHQDLRAQLSLLKRYRQQVKSLEHDLTLERDLHEITRSSLLSLTSDHDMFRRQITNMYRQRHQKS